MAQEAHLHMPKVFNAYYLRGRLTHEINFLSWKLKKLSFETCPAVLWLRLYTPKAGGLGPIWSGSSPGEGIGYPFQYSWASLVA